MSKSDPVKRIEVHQDAVNSANEMAEHYASKGWTFLTKLARRQAAGHKAAITRIARQELGA